jgi:hypothetical protein
MLRNKSRAEILDNFKLEQLYSHEIENGRFFKVVFPDDDTAECKLPLIRTA